MSTALESSTQHQRSVLALISVGHFINHFYLLLLPPLFFILRDVYQVGFTELGLALAVMSFSTMLTEIPVGILVDRYGARALLIGGVVLGSLAYIGIALVPNYSALMVLMVLVGISNSVYHPANYAIMDATVDEARMGRAYSIHAFGGYLGTAAAPVTVIFLTTLMGWQLAVLACGGVGLLLALVMWSRATLLVNAHRLSADREVPSGSGKRRTALQLLTSMPILLGLVFFATLSMAEYAVSDFGISTLMLMHDVPITSATLALSAYLFAGPIGVLAGGWIADRIRAHDRLTAACMCGFAGCLFVIAGSPLSWGMVIVVFAVAGFTAGMVAPPRDLMIRSITPPGDMGKVFGFVAIGFTLGGIVAPPLFGFILDYAQPHLLFLLAGVVGLISAGVALVTTPGGAVVRAPARDS